MFPQGAFPAQSGAGCPGACWPGFIRYLCHTGVGASQCGRTISIPAHDALIYSIVYNASYMVPRPSSPLSVRFLWARCWISGGKPSSGCRRLPARAPICWAGLCLAAAVAFDALMLYNAVQTEEGFVSP